MENIKKVIVTGATGVVGTALVKELISRNIEVLVLARKNGRINKIPEHPLVKIAFCALDEIEGFNLPNEKYDIFFHLGWLGTYGADRNDFSIQSQNVKYTLDAVRLAHRLGCSVFIGTGSQAENGVLPCGEKVSATSPENPASAYGKAKLIAGKESYQLCEESGIRHNWCRILSVYGPADAPYTMIMSTLIKMLRNEDCSFTPAEQQWDYIYSGDVAEALLAVAEKGVNGKTYPIGYGKTMQLKEYIKKMSDVTNTQSKCILGAIDYYPNQPMYLCADIESLTNDTGFSPSTTFEKGIKETIKYITENHL